MRIVKEGLEVDLCRLLETGVDDHSLLHSAGCGWDDVWVREQRFDVVAETEDRFVLGTRESIVVADYETERRFRASPIQRTHGVRSAVEVLICGAGGMYGVVGAYAREPGRFDADSANFMQNVSNTLAAFIERKTTEDRLAYMAQFDALTGLPNRSLYLDRLGHTLLDAARDKFPVAVLFVDIDRFKSVNDSLGHSAGDALLVKIAERLRAAVRLGDTIGRLSGDEFAVALGHLPRDEDAGTIAQKIVDALAAPFAIYGHTVYVSASVGISVYPSDGVEPDVLLKNADTAMYRAKQGGRNGYQFYLPQMQVRASERLRLETELRGALDRGEYVLFYQPKVDLVSGSLSGLEALLRWQSPTRGLVAPGEFIAVLEEAGLIIPVGEWVIATVCAQIRRWQGEGLVVPPVAVNLSARQFRQDDLDSVVGRLLADSGIDPNLLEFELTESMLMSDSESAVETLHQIKARGIRLALDDFGTGYSSLAYLKRFPLDALKIDQAFIRDVTTDSDDASIVLAIINLARNLKLKVIAEGVETEEQLAFLYRQGCDEVQGFHIARPMPVDCMSVMLRAGFSLRAGDAGAYRESFDVAASRTLTGT
jgi:diguanylate cyclase (GGDEF)-like protein